jgi:uncharacterized protein YkwD
MDYNKNLTQYENVSVDTLLAAADNLSATPRSLVAAKANETIFVQKVCVSVFTDNAATQTLQSITTNEIVVATKASPGLGPLQWDFGIQGYGLPEGEGLELANSGAGLGAAISVQAYRRRTASGVP